MWKKLNSDVTPVGSRGRFLRQPYLPMVLHHCVHWRFRELPLRCVQSMMSRAHDMCDISVVLSRHISHACRMYLHSAGFCFSFSSTFSGSSWLMCKLKLKSSCHCSAHFLRLSPLRKPRFRHFSMPEKQVLSVDARFHALHVHFSALSLKSP